MTFFRLVASLALSILPADWSAPPVRQSVTFPPLPATVPAAEVAQIDAWAAGCTYTHVGASVVTAAHCVGSGWQVDGDRAWQGPEPEWAPPLPRGATVWAVGFPGGVRTTFSLAVLQVQTTPYGETLMTYGAGNPCTPGSSGAVGWVTVDGAVMPVGPLSVYSTTPSVTGLPSGQFVCGFALGG